MTEQHPARAFLDRVAAHDPVPCGNCRACCRGNQAVELRVEWGDDPALYGRDSLQVENLVDHYGVVLRRHPNGDCIFLGPQGCTIHERRPATCRGFDCRRVALLFSGTGRREEAIRRGIFSAEIFTAADERMPTLDLLEEERTAFGTDDVADRVLLRSQGAVR